MDEWYSLWANNTDLEDCVLDPAEWSQADLLALIRVVDAELTRRNAVQPGAERDAG